MSLFRFVVAAMSVGMLSTSVEARPVTHWSETELWREADVVVIGAALGTKDPKGVPGRKPERGDKVTVETEFSAAVVLKGKFAGDTVSVHHHRYLHPDDETEIIDGPSLLYFDPAKKRRYVIFLKQNAETKAYEPLTGQYDPDQSFLEIKPYHISRERNAKD